MQRLPLLLLAQAKLGTPKNGAFGKGDIGQTAGALNRNATNEYVN